MTLKDIRELKMGTWVTLRDGREGIYLNVNEYSLSEGLGAFVIVNLPNEDNPYSHDEAVWPAQIVRKK